MIIGRRIRLALRKGISMIPAIVLLIRNTYGFHSAPKNLRKSKALLCIVLALAVCCISPLQLFAQRPALILSAAADTIDADKILKRLKLYWPDADLPSFAAAPAGYEVDFAAARKQFPETVNGKKCYWNHAGIEEDEYLRNQAYYNYTYTLKPCQTHNENTLRDTCNTIRILTLEKWIYYQCSGFALTLATYLFGIDPITDMWNDTRLWTYHDSFDRLRPGDLIIYQWGKKETQSHMVMVVTKEKDYIKIVEGNSDRRCHINWDRKISRRTLEGYYKVEYFGHPDTINTKPAPTLTYIPLALKDSGTQVKYLQRRLNELGYSCGKVDGKYGSKTQAAVKAFQEANGLQVTGNA